MGHGQIMLGGQLLPCWSELISTTAPFRLFFCAPDLDACPKSLTMLLLRCSMCMAPWLNGLLYLGLLGWSGPFGPLPTGV